MHDCSYLHLIPLCCCLFRRNHQGICQTLPRSEEDGAMTRGSIELGYRYLFSRGPFWGYIEIVLLTVLSILPSMVSEMISESTRIEHESCDSG